MRAVFAFLFLVCFVCICDAGEPMDLLRAVELALDNNKSLALSRLSLGKSEIDTEIARSAFGVKVGPVGSAGVQSGDETVGFGLRASKRLAWGSEVELAASLSNSWTTDETNMFSGRIGIQINQPLFRNAGALVNIEAIARAESAEKEGLRLLEMRKADTVVSVVVAYVDVLLLNGRMASAEAAAVRMERLRRLTKALERQGRTTHVDSLRVELQYGETLAEYESVKDRYESRMKDLAELLGQDIDTVFALEPVPLVEEELPDAAQALLIAMENRLDYAQVLADEVDSERTVRIGRKRLWPELRLVTRYERFGEGEDTDAAVDLNESVWFVGLSTDTDLRREEEHLALSQALVGKEMASKNIEILGQAIERQVEQLLSAHGQAIEEVKIRGRNLELARARRELARRLFEMGRGDNFSVTDGENAYMAAEIQFLQAQSAVTVTGYRLRRALGTLIEAPLDLKVSTLQEQRQ
jgi:outer membrane protein TolC